MLSWQEIGISHLRVLFCSRSAAISLFIDALLFRLVYFPSLRWWWEAKLWHSGPGASDPDLSFREQAHFKETLDPGVQHLTGSRKQAVSRDLLISQHILIRTVIKQAYTYPVPGKRSRSSQAPGFEAGQAQWRHYIQKRLQFSIS